jgi:hypothetical protein
MIVAEAKNASMDTTHTRSVEHEIDGRYWRWPTRSSVRETLKARAARSSACCVFVFALVCVCECVRTSMRTKVRVGEDTKMDGWMDGVRGFSLILYLNAFLCTCVFVILSYLCVCIYQRAKVKGDRGLEMANRKKRHFEYH